jgi:hypothetical protein
MIRTQGLNMPTASRLPNLDRDLVPDSIFNSEHIVLPAQWDAGQRKHSGQIALLWAILDDAVTLATSPPTTDKSKERSRKEAQNWILHKDWYVFSFELVCQYLEISAFQVRKALVQQFRDEAVYVARKTNRQSPPAKKEGRPQGDSPRPPGRDPRNNPAASDLPE